MGKTRAPAGIYVSEDRRDVTEKRHWKYRERTYAERDWMCPECHTLVVARRGHRCSILEDAG